MSRVIFLKKPLLLFNTSCCCRLPKFGKFSNHILVSSSSPSASLSSSTTCFCLVSPCPFKSTLPLLGKRRVTRHLVCRQLTTPPDDANVKPEVGVVNIPFWGRLLVVAGIGGIVFYLYYSAQEQKELESEQYRYKEFKSIQLGGDWTLTDHHGNKRSSTDFRGHWVVMYMGFTHCPDICPEEMEKLGDIVLHFDADPKLPNLQPVFITLDPERDNPEVIRDYLKEFQSPRIVGFTGSDDEIRTVAKKFRAYYGQGERNADNDYIVDHTIIIYLINPKGEFVNFYDRSLTAEQVTNSIKGHIKKYNELEKKQP